MRNNKIILYWLCLSALAVIFTVIIGGYTRLTNSGLSIVEWKPVTGIYFPLAESSWLKELSKYEASPEYRDINVGMSLDEFKKIYIVEYLHRIAGRLVAIVFILPFILFTIGKKLNSTEIKFSILVCGLILFQGFFGWYMVSSGIADLPYVSHFRLALHLIIAVIIYALIFWMICVKINFSPNMSIHSKNLLTIKRIFGYLLLIVLIWQIFLGGLVAGSKAGYIYNSFPRMDGRLIPPEIWNFRFQIKDLSNVLYIQFFHRIFAYILCFLCFLYSIFIILFSGGMKIAILSSLFLLLALICQVIFGILTLVYIVPIPLGLLHQFFSIILLSLVIWNIYVNRFKLKAC